MPPRDEELCRPGAARLAGLSTGRVDYSANGVIRSVRPAEATAYRTTTRRGCSANRSTYHEREMQQIAIVKNQQRSDLRSAHHANKKSHAANYRLYRAAGGMDAPDANRPRFRVAAQGSARRGGRRFRRRFGALNYEIGICVKQQNSAGFQRKGFCFRVARRSFT
jgi:hypothetical protein